jgi:ABC-2 type transport system ATP-binding protein
VGLGEIYGFLGLNGAGKTTTIRALLGMIHPSQGSVKVLGQPVGPNGHGPWQRVGHLVEVPSAYPDLTVLENLEAARRLQRIPDRCATQRILESLGLAPYRNRKAGVLSTGNLQRLGLARALLHEPDLLILDEPANGLDPAGVVEIRELLKRLSKEKGTTIFMSSHILTEVDRLATRIGIIHQGRLLEELGTAKLEELRSRRLEVRTRNLKAAQRVLNQAGFSAKISDGSISLFETRAQDAPDEIATLLVKAGVPPTRLDVVHEELEDYFLRLTGGKS